MLTMFVLLGQCGFGHVSSHELRIEVVKTGSMLPNIPINSMLTVDESFYETSNPQRFDIVIVVRSVRSSPIDRIEKTMNVLSRVVGLPGETIAMRRGRIYINGRRIKEPFAINPCPTTLDESFPCGEMSTMRIPAGQYFVLADNRPESEDSRLWSPQTVPRSAVVGKVVKVAAPSTASQQVLTADSPVSGPNSGALAEAQRSALPTAKRLRNEAQGCRCGYPGLAKTPKRQPQRGCDYETATRSGLKNDCLSNSGLKQLWAVRRNRFAVGAPAS